MNRLRNSSSRILSHRPRNLHALSATAKCIFTILTHYETPKVVRFESKWIASLSLFVKLSLAIGCIYLTYQQSPYQIFDRSPISAVTIKIKLSPKCSSSATLREYLPSYNCSQSESDINDFILPAIENSAISITTRITEVEHVLKSCNNRTKGEQKTKSLPPNAVAFHKCYNLTSRCILPPFYRTEDENDALPTTQLCWFKSSNETTKKNYRALDYILFVKNYVEFPQLNFSIQNIDKDIAKKDYFDTCEYDNKTHLLCPKFRVLKILEMIGKSLADYESMLHNGSLIEIKISWMCNLDKPKSRCKPLYEFISLDYPPHEEHPYEPGSNFLTSKHFFEPNDRELHRVHIKIYNLHILVSVTGEVRKFDLFQTTTSIGSFVGVFSIGTIVCDLIAAFFTNFKRVKYDS